MKPQYIFDRESNAPAKCEWGTFAEGYECDEPQTWVVIDTADKSDRMYPEGFHEAHLCDLHIQEAAHLYHGA